MRSTDKPRYVLLSSVISGSRIATIPDRIVLDLAFGNLANEYIVPVPTFPRVLFVSNLCLFGPPDTYPEKIGSADFVLRLTKMRRPQAGHIVAFAFFQPPMSRRTVQYAAIYLGGGL
jgi:hypothetical protein